MGRFEGKQLERRKKWLHEEAERLRQVAFFRLLQRTASQSSWRKSRRKWLADAALRPADKNRGDAERTYRTDLFYVGLMIHLVRRTIVTIYGRVVLPAWRVSQSISQAILIPS